MQIYTCTIQNINILQIDLVSMQCEVSLIFKVGALMCVW